MPDWNAALANAKPAKLAGTLLRLVESQEQVATNQLVASLDRLAVLEDLLEATKPPRRKGTEHVHYLLSTPFRYPPLKRGSRFGARSEPSLFYGSLETRTVLAETAYTGSCSGTAWRLRLPANWTPNIPCSRRSIVPGRACGCRRRPSTGIVRTRQPVRLSRQPDARYGDARSRHRSPRVRFHARPGSRHQHRAVYPQGPCRKMPVSQEAWLCELTGERVRFHTVRGRDIHAFSLEAFLVVA